MKSFLKKSIAGLAILALLASFTHRPGGEGFEIYVDNQLLVQRFGNEMNAVQPVSLSNRESSKLYIKYFHCGKTGTNRSITVKDNRNNTLHQFRFEDSRAASGVMMLEVKDIRALVKDANTSLQLYYSSGELPAGRMLATVNF
jgi:hypothetical protein